MVQSISNPGVSQVVVPGKPAAQTPPSTAGQSAEDAAPARSPGSATQPVQQSPKADAEKHEPDQRAREKPAVPVAARQLSIAHDAKANRYVYRGVERGTHEVHGQWPTEQALKRIAVLREMTGKILDEES